MRGELAEYLVPEMILDHDQNIGILGPIKKASQRTGEKAMATLQTLSCASVRIAREQKLSAALDFWVKSIRGPVELGRWITFIAEHHLALGAPSPNTRVLRKPQRNYGRTGRTVRQRVDALVAHYKYSAAQLPSAIHGGLLEGTQIRLARIAARNTHFDLWLGSSLAPGQKQEGELTVSFTDSDDVVLTRMAFSFGVDDDGIPTALIGGVQGLDAGIDKRVIVKATRTLSGLRPKDATLVALQAVATAAGILRLRAVSNATHVLVAEWYSRDSVILRDYDAFWIERGGTAVADGGYILPLRDYGARLKEIQTPRTVDRHRSALSDQVQLRLASGDVRVPAGNSALPTP